MFAQQRIYALKSHGVYVQNTIPSNHPSIVTANQKKVRLSYSRCNQIYKGESFFKDPQIEEFYLRSRSTPSKNSMTKSQISTMSTKIGDSDHKGRGNSLEYSRNCAKKITFNQHSNHNSPIRCNKPQVNAFARYQFQQANKFQLPEYISVKNGHNLYSSRTPAANYPFKIQITSTDQRLKNSHIYNSSNKNKLDVQTQRKYQSQQVNQEQSIKKHELIINKGQENKMKIQSQINNKNLLKQQTEIIKLKQRYSTPKRRQQDVQFKRSGNQDESQTKMIKRKIIYTPNDKVQPIFKSQNKRKISYQQYQILIAQKNHVSPRIFQKQKQGQMPRLNLRQKPQSKDITILSQDYSKIAERKIKIQEPNITSNKNAYKPISATQKLNKNTAITATGISFQAVLTVPSVPVILAVDRVNTSTFKTSDMDKVAERKGEDRINDQLSLLKEQLARKDKQLRQCKYNLYQSQNREKLLSKQLLNKQSLNNAYTGNVDQKAESYAHNTQNQSMRNWSSELKHELIKDLPSTVSQYYPLYMLVLFMVMFSKHTLTQ